MSSSKSAASSHGFVPSTPRQKQKRLRAAAIEALESRRLLSTYVWKTDGNGSWTDPNNWTQPGGGIGYPTSGDTAVFGDVTSADRTITLSTTVGAAIQFNSTHAYNIVATGGASFSGLNVQVTGGSANDVIDVPVQSFAISYAVDNEGLGILDLQGTLGSVNSDAFFQFSGSGTTRVSGTVPALNFLQAGSAVGPKTGTLRIDGDASAAGGVGALAGSTIEGTGKLPQVTIGGVLSPGPGVGTLTATGLDIQGGALSIDVNGASAGSYDQVNVNGAVKLEPNSKLQLNLGYTPTIGDSYTIINNDGSDPVSGTFAGLPEGADAVVGGHHFAISYVGGSGNDVTLTAESAPASTTISGHIYEDKNANLQEDPGDGRLAGDTIYADINDSGTLDAGDPSVVADASGNYTLNVPDGLPHTIRRIVPAGEHPVSPDLTNIAGTNITGANFGDFKDMSVTGVIFNDLNDNGVKDSGEPALSGSTVNLVTFLNSQQQIVQTTTTDSQGNYSFTGIGPINGNVALVLPQGSIQTNTDPGISPTSGAHIVEPNAIGIFTPVATISGTAFVDTNGNGVQDSGETVLGSTIVFADGSNGHPKNGIYDTGEVRAFTAADGSYTLDLTAAGTFPILVSTGLTTNAPTEQVNAGDHISGVNLGLFRYAQVQTFVFNDSNGDGVRQSNEGGVPNVTVFLDGSNGGALNGQLDAGELSTTTNTSGIANFSNLGPGTIQVRIVAPNGLVQTTADPAAITLTSGQFVDSSVAKFGLATPNSISGNIFLDKNGDGIFDGNDTNQAGVTVQLDAGADGTIDATTTTDTSGNYIFSNLAPGTYRIREVSPAGLVMSTAQPADITLSTDQSVGSINFGNFKPITISGNVFNDLNGDQVKGAGDTGIAGVTVHLHNGSKANDLTAITDSNGNYTFNNVGPNFFSITVDAPSGYLPEYRNYNVATPPTGSFPITITSGTNVTQNAGLVQGSWVLGQIMTTYPHPKTAGEISVFPFPFGGPTVYLDDNDNGQLDPGEIRAQADEEGEFSIIAPAGDHHLRVTIDPAGPGVRLGYDTVNGDGNKILFESFALFVPSTQISGNVFNDADGDGTKDNGETGVSGQIVGLYSGNVLEESAATDTQGRYFLSAFSGSYTLKLVSPLGTETFPTGDGTYSLNLAANDSLTGQDFGEELPTTGSISGTVFNDNNGDGQLDGADAGIAGVTLFLDGTNGQPYNDQFDAGEVSTTTGADGSYIFSNIPAGSYHVDEVLPSGAFFTTFTDISPVSVAATPVTGIDFGNFTRVTLGGQVFDDINGDGIKNNGESGRSGVTVNLDRNADGTVDATATTDSSGNFSFTNNGYGTYRLRIVVPANNTQTTVDPADITVASGLNNSSITFGVQRNPSTFTINNVTQNEGDGGNTPFVFTITRGGDVSQQSQILAQISSGTATEGVDYVSSNGVTLTFQPGETSKTFTVNVIGDTQYEPDETFSVVLSPKLNASIVAGGGVGTIVNDDAQPTTGTISGVVFTDNNANGTQDVGDDPIEGAFVFIDGSNNRPVDGQHEPGETIVTTAADGSYSFANLQPGTYDIVEIPQGGFVATTSSDVEVTVAAGQTSTVTYGNFQSAKLNGVVFNDLNGDGIQESGEPGIANATLFLDGSNGQPLNGQLDPGETTALSSNLSGSIGAFGFTVGLGTYHVLQSLPSGFVQTTIDPAAVTIDHSGQVINGLIFGRTQPPTVSSISGIAFDDFNGNGVMDSGESPLSGVKIQLDLGANGSVDATATTDSNGAYSFGNLSAGTYRIREVLPSGTVQTTTNPPDLALSAGTVKSGVNFGTFKLISISGKAFNDLVRDGAQTVGDTVRSGVTVQLDKGANGSVDTTTTTNSSGQYTFANLGPGIYRIRIVIPSGTMLSSPLPADLSVFSGVSPGGINFALAPTSPVVTTVIDPLDNTKTALQITGSDSNDTISLTKSGSSQGKVVVKINGSTKGTYSFSGNIVVYGWKGNDTISIDGAITRTALVYGGDGNDSISGGGGNDVLVGQAGNDTLNGNAGRDILLGGADADKLNGGSGDDILVGGTTANEDQLFLAAALLKEWTRTDKNYTFRSQHIQSGGGLNGSILLNAGNVFAQSGKKDSLTGGSDSDLFFAAVPGDVLTDKVGGETTVDVG